jgi:predicted small metal-binding protein
MPKTLACRDVGMDCEFKIQGETEDEVVRKAGEHARNVHKIEKISPDLERKVRSSIRDQR